MKVLVVVPLYDAVDPFPFMVVGIGICRPQMLSPRFRIESTGAGAASPSPGPATRSSSRKKASTPKVSLHNDDDNGGIDDSSRAVGSDHSNGNSDDNNEYDSDKCPTLELSSPLRSCGVSSRDLEVLTPSIAREKGDAGNDSAGGGYDRGSSCNDQGGGGSDGGDSDVCPTPELSSPLRSAGSAALCRRRLEEADGEGYGGGGDEKEAVAAELTACDGPLELVSEEEYARVSSSAVAAVDDGAASVLPLPVLRPTSRFPSTGRLSILHGTEYRFRVGAKYVMMEGFPRSARYATG